MAILNKKIMNKLSLFLLLIISTSLYSQTVSDLERLGNINGKVKLVKETHYTLTENFGEYEIKEMLYREDYNINENGKIKSILFIPKSGYHSHIHQFFYNDAGVVERLNYSFIDQEPNKFVLYEYEDNLLIDVKFYEDYEMKLNEPNYLPKIIEFIDGNLLKGHYMFNYNQNRDLISFEHNHNGSYSTTSSTIGTFPYFKYYKALDRIISIRNNFDHYDTRTNRYGSESYEEDNLLKVKLGTAKDSYSPKAKREDIIIEYIKITKAFEYTYDQNGNWIECIISYLEKPVEIIKRDISYFE